LVHFKNSVNPGLGILLNCTFVKTVKLVKQWFWCRIHRNGLLVLSRRSLVDHFQTSGYSAAAVTMPGSGQVQWYGVPGGGGNGGNGWWWG